TADFNSEEPSLRVPRMGRDGDYAALSAKLADAKKQLDDETRRVDAGRAEWEKSVDRSKLPKELADALALPADKRSKAQADALIARHRSTSATWKTLDAEVRKLEADIEQVSTSAMILKEIAPRPTYVAIRGEFRNHGPAVQPGVPAALHAAPAGVKL